MIDGALNAWERSLRRNKNWKEFDEAGADHVRSQVAAGNWDTEKLKDARAWLRRRETLYARIAVGISIVSLFVSAIVSGCAAWVTYQNGQIARAADRAWLGPASMRLNEKPAGGKRLEFLFEYQNSGRQPALKVSHFLGSHALTGPDDTTNRKRALEDVEACKRLGSGDHQVIFPGKGNLEPYHPTSELLSKAIEDHSPIYIDGCFAYQTLGEPHHTAFCFKYDPDFPRYDHPEGKLLLDLCDFGHYAD
ncbi:hypothetical protein [Bradyrhizobium guangzhouense]|uniref:hypothetical protein n=1 Tax=Bradyrhizobium guangzhouense TaxID=1325095 RepID=UPI001009F4B2|nr:hypothetical protein [Bradyrhizobium guangzhouense]RXH12732.1 hypothetical protein EAS54_25205 [Bradyrhizobium guangzhouense]